jgi:hypothetical protein
VFLLSTRVDADLRRLAINPTVMGENRMFKTAAAAEPITDVMDPADTVPLSVLALDLDAPSAGGWHAYLASRGIAVLGDDVGRDSITKADARRLAAGSLLASRHGPRLRRRVQTLFGSDQGLTAPGSGSSLSWA